MQGWEAICSCPIGLEVVGEGAVVAPDGFTYDRSGVEMWRMRNGSSPVTGLPMVGELYPNRVLVQLLGWIRSEEEKRRVAEMSKDSELQSLRMSLGIMRGEMERMGREGGEIRKMREELEAARQEREAGIRGDGARAGVWQGQISVLQGRCDMYRRELVRRGGDEIGVELVWAKGTLWMGKVSKWITVHELIGRVNSELEVPVWVVRLICRGKGLVGEGVLVDLGAVEKWSVYGETVARP